MYFYSDTWGIIDLPKIVNCISQFVADLQTPPVIAVATDSQVLARGTKFVSVITVYRLGKGGQFYRNWELKKQKIGMKERITYEANKSLQIAGHLNKLLLATDLQYDFEVHLDCGSNGDSKSLISELTAKVLSKGYNAKIKPDSYAASWVANKYTKTGANPSSKYGTAK